MYSITNPVTNNVELYLVIQFFTPVKLVVSAKIKKLVRLSPNQFYEYDKK